MTKVFKWLFHWIAKILFGLFYSLVYIVLLLALVLASSLPFIEQTTRSHWFTWLPDQPFPYLQTIILGLTALVAFLTLARERKDKTYKERQRQHSAILCKQAIAGLDNVYRLLKDRNNNQLIWNQAALILLKAQKLADNIKNPAIMESYELQKEQIRSKLYFALTMENSEKNRSGPLPPQFFYGIDDWQTSEKTPVALGCEAEQQREARNAQHYTPTIKKLDARPPRSKELYPKSVVAIYDFLAFPENFQDALKAVKLWPEQDPLDFKHSGRQHEGALKYVMHRRSWPAYYALFEKSETNAEHLKKSIKQYHNKQISEKTLSDGLPVRCTKEAWQDYDNFWLKQDKKNLKLINQLIVEAMGLPTGGKGNPKALIQHSAEDLWSRSIDNNHRLVYFVEKNTIAMISCRNHP